MFLPIDLVLKDESNPPAASSTSLIQRYSKMEGQSETQFTSQRKECLETATKIQTRQGKDVLLCKKYVNEQKRYILSTSSIKLLL